MNQSNEDGRPAKLEQSFSLQGSFISYGGPSDMPVDEASAQREKLARSETKAVNLSKAAVCTVLLATAIAACFSVYAYTRNDEGQDFETQFNASARLILDAFHDSVESQLGALGTLSTLVTSHALATDQQFPFVTVNDFELLACHTRVAAQTVAVQWTPLLKDDSMRRKWEAYALKHRSHIDEAFESDATWRAVQDREFGYDINNSTRRLQRETSNVPADDNILQDGTGYHKRVWNIRTKLTEAEGSAPYIVAWQRSPVNSLKQKFLNMNIARAPALEGGLVQAVQDTHEVVINKAIIPVSTGVAQFSSNLLIGQYRHDAESYVNDPVSFVGYPVFSNFTVEREVVGLVVANLYWRLHFADILDESVTGIICVLENSFNQTIRYRVDGKEVTYEGEGDIHDENYDKFVFFADVNKFVQDRASPETRAYTTAPLNKEYNRYTLRVYPSAETERKFRTNKPTIYTVAVAAIFAFASAVFLTYDCLVERRQTVVLTRAEKASAIVSDLFPETVRNRVYDSNEADAKEPENIFHRNSTMFSVDGDKEQTNLVESIIADRYDASTVLFMDIAGFTSWSDGRNPQDVFRLLETLYGAFDVLAKRRCVLKVETIGDCYMAVAGVPHPQRDHVVRIVKFALDCLDKATQVLQDLAEELGEGTMNLRLRAGLHCGPVTGGVLRGQKSRFQLFGDTVNTAARMESNGSPGRVHISQSAADEMKLIGYNSWVTKRDTEISVKGKGSMQTYWVRRASTTEVTAETVEEEPHSYWEI